jgi:hypothetical protein
VATSKFGVITDERLVIFDGWYTDADRDVQKHDLTDQKRSGGVNVGRLVALEKQRYEGDASKYLKHGS